MGLDKLVEWLISIIKDVVPFFIVRAYQEAILLRGGVYYKSYKPGFYLKIPFLDELVEHHVTITTINLPAQSLVTTDNKNIVVKAIIKYKVIDIKTFLIDVFNASDALADITQGIIKTMIMGSTWKECINVEIDNTISKKVRVEAKKFGIQVDFVTLTDIAEMRTLKLINQTEKVIDG